MLLLNRQSSQALDPLGLTRAEFDADAFFPVWPREQFDIASSESHTTPEGLTYRYVDYRRKVAA